VGGAPVVSGVPMRGPSGNAPGQVAPQSPSVAQGGAPRPGAVGGGAVASGVPMHGQSGPAPVQARPLPAPHTATGPQGNTRSGSWTPRMVAPNGAERPGGTQMHSFNPRGARFAQGGAGGDAAPIGRSGGAWIPNHGGGAAVGGNNNMGGRQPMAGGQGRAWGGGGGNRMGGSSMR